MSHPHLLTRGKTALVVVDVQEKFAPVIAGFGDMVENITKLILTFKTFNMPVVVTEQNPQGLGPTVAELRTALGQFQPITKMAFSCMGEKAFGQHMSKLGVDAVVVCGIETHVCVNQTVHDLLAANVKVHVVADAISTRKGLDHRMGMEKMIKSGAIPCTSEMVMFELLGSASAPEFKSVQQMIKGRTKKAGTAASEPALRSSGVSPAPVAASGAVQSAAAPKAGAKPVAREATIDDVFAVVESSLMADETVVGQPPIALPSQAPATPPKAPAPKHAHGEDVEVLDIETLVDLRDASGDTGKKGH